MASCIPCLGRGRQNLVIITDPGPDPDDVKALLVAGVLHRHRTLHLSAVVANGGQQAMRRARLARCVLDKLGAYDVPVGVGSEGKEYKPQPHEYAIDGIDQVDSARLRSGQELLISTLRAAVSNSLTFVCISSLRDLADVMDEHPALVMEKVVEVAVQGGLERDEEGTWQPDTSVNNMFDLEGARCVYRFCMDHGLPLTVVSRNAVPMLPMQLAKSFAVRTSDSIMSYLAKAQFLGLEGLWQKLCEGKLPARCTKQWYFETFCGVSRDQFEADDLEALTAEEDIVRHLNGFVKPYDVICLMSVMHHTRADFPPSEPGQGPHRLFLRVEHTVSADHVLQALRNTYHEAVILAHATPPPELKISHTSAADRWSRARASQTPSRSSEQESRRHIDHHQEPDPASGPESGPGHSTGQKSTSVSRAGRFRSPLSHARAALGRGDEDRPPLAVSAPDTGQEEVRREGAPALDRVAPWSPCSSTLATSAEASAEPSRRRRPTSRTIEPGELVQALRAPVAPGARASGGERGSVEAGPTAELSPFRTSKARSLSMSLVGCHQSLETNAFSSPVTERRRTQPRSENFGTVEGLASAGGMQTGGRRSGEGAARRSRAEVFDRSLFAIAAEREWAARSSCADDDAADMTIVIAPPAAAAADDNDDEAAPDLVIPSARTPAALKEAIEIAMGKSARATCIFSGMMGGAGLATVVLVLVFFLAQPLTEVRYTVGWFADPEGVVASDVLSVLYIAGSACVLIAVPPEHRFLNLVRAYAVLEAALCAIAVTFVVVSSVSQDPVHWRASLTWQLWVYDAVLFSAMIYIVYATVRFWRSAAGLHGSLCLAIGSVSLAEVGTVLLHRFLLGWTTGSRGPGVVASTWLRAAVELGLAVFIVSPGFRSGLRARFSRLFSRASHAHQFASLAPILGYGTDHVPTRDLVGEAVKVFAPVKLDAWAMHELTEQWLLDGCGSFTQRRQRRFSLTSLPSAGRTISVSRQVSRSRSTARVHPSGASGAPSAAAGLDSMGDIPILASPATDDYDEEPERLPHANAARSSGLAPSAPRTAPAQADDKAQRTERLFRNGLRTRAQAWMRGSRFSTDVSTSSGSHHKASIADYYIVHTDLDYGPGKAEALALWLEGRTSTTPPRVWVHPLCADVGLLPHEHLSHMPIYVAMCRKLLVVAGSNLPDSLWFGAVLHTWASLGRSLDDVEVIVATDPAVQDAQQQVVAAFDTFAVMYSRMRGLATETQIVQTVQLASANVWNEQVRALVPIIRDVINRANGVHDARVGTTQAGPPAA